MPCKIEFVKLPSGEESKLFSQLNAVLSPNLALENYLHIKENESEYIKLYGENKQGEANYDPAKGPKFKLVEFKNKEVQKDIVDTLSMLSLKVLRNLSGGTDATTISGLNLEKLSKRSDLANILTTGVKGYLKIIIENQNLSEYQREVYQNMYNELPYYFLVNKNLGIVGRALQEYGVNLRVKNTYVSGESDFQSEELELVTEDLESYEAREVAASRIYDLDVTEQALEATISPQVKGYLRTIRQVDASRFNPSVSSNVEFLKNKIGENKPANYSQLITTLYNVIEGSQTIEDMIDSIEEALPQHPILAPVYNDLIAEKKVKISKKGAKIYKPRSSALFTTFARVNYNMATVVTQKNSKVTSWSIADRGNRQQVIKDTIIKDVEAAKAEFNDVGDKVKDMQFWKSKLESAGKATYTQKKYLGTIQNKSISQIKATYKKDGKFEKFLRKFFPDTGTLTNDQIREIKEITSNIGELNYEKFFNNDALLQGVVNQFHTAGIYGMNLTVLKKFPSKFEINPYTRAASLVSLFIDKILIPSIKGNNVMTFNSKGEKGESKLLGTLVDMLQLDNSATLVKAFYSNSGGHLHPINKSHEFQDMFNRFRRGKIDFETFRIDPIYRKSILTSQIENDTSGEIGKIHTVVTVGDYETSSTIPKFKDAETFQSISSKMAGYEGKGLSEGLIYAFAPTFGDRGSAHAMAVRKLNVDKNGHDNHVFDYSNPSNPKLLEGPIKEWIKNTIEGEVERALISKQEEKSFKFYSGKEGKALTFTTFPELNSLVDLSSVTTRTEKDIVNQAMSNMDGIFFNLINEDIQVLKDNYMLGEESAFKGEILKYSPIREAALSKSIPKMFINPTKELVDNFLANNFIYTSEIIKYVAGDMAFYKDNNQLSKRLSLFTTPGDKLAMGDGSGVPKTYELMVIEEPKVESPNSKQYSYLFDGRKIMNEIDLSDGVGYVSLARYKYLLQGLGVGNAYVYDYIDRLLAYKPSTDGTYKKVPNPHNISLEILKGFSSSLIKKNSKIVPVSTKYSVVPVIPNYYEQKIWVNNKPVYKFTGMAEISRLLNREGGPDEIVPESSFKLTGFDVNDLSDNKKERKTITMPNESYRFPQPTPTKKEISTKFGSQIRKLISDIVPTGSIALFGNKMKETEALKYYQDAIKAIVEEGSSSLLNTFIVGGELNKKAIVEYVLDRMLSVNNMHTNSSYIEEALSITANKNGKAFPISYPTMFTSMDSNINSSFKNATNRFKTNGYQAVQIPSMGTKHGEHEVSIGSDLKFIRFGKVTTIDGNSTVEEMGFEESKPYLEKIKNGIDITDDPSIKIIPAEVRVTEKYFTTAVKNMSKTAINNRHQEFLKAGSDYIKLIKKFNKDKYSEQELTRMKSEAIQEARDEASNEMVEAVLNKYRDNKGVLSVEKFKETEEGKKMLELVGYRIPTGSKSTAFPATIFEFMPGDENNIQIPAEIVEQAGSDFDWDKVYVQYRSLSLEGKTLKPKLPSLENNNISKIKTRFEGIIEKIKKESEDFVGVTTDGKEVEIGSGVDYKWYKRRGKKTLYERTTNYLSEEKVDKDKDYVKESIALGNKVDSIIRDLFSGKKIDLKRLKDLSNSDSVSRNFISQLKELPLYKQFNSGEIDVIASDIIVYDDVSKTAGTLDLLTFNNKTGQVSIIDVKTMRQDLFKVESYGTRYESTTAFKDKKPIFTETRQSYAEKHAKQLSTYRTALNNTYGINATSLKILPIKLDYNKGDTKTKELTIFPEYNHQPVDYKKVSFNSSKTDYNLQTSPVNINNATDVLFEFQRAVLTSTNHVKDLLYPNDKEVMDKLLKDRYKVREAQDKPTTFATLKTQEAYKKINKAGKSLIGISAIANTSNVIFPQLGVSLSTPLKIAGEEINLTRRFEIGNPKRKIQENTKEFLNAAVDNANDPVLGEVNVNELTAPTILFLIAAGFPMTFALDVVNAPIVKYYIGELQNLSKRYSSLRTAKLAAAEKTRNKFDIKRVDFSAKFDVGSYTQKAAYDAISEDSTAYKRKQTDAFKAFLQIEPYGKAFGSFQNTLNFDSSGTPSSAGRLRQVYSELAKIPGTDAYSRENSSGRQLLDAPTKNKIEFKVDRDKYKNHPLRSYEHNSIFNPMKVNEKTSIAGSKVGESLVMMAKKKFKYLSLNQVDHLLNEFSTFLLQNSTSFPQSKSGISMMIDNNEHLPLISSSSSESVYNQIKAYKKRKSILNPGAPINTFVQGLSHETDGDFVFITFPKGTTVLGTEARDLNNSFEELMKSEDPLDRKLARDLANYAAIFQGFSTTREGFMPYLPVQAHFEYLGSDKGTSSPDFFNIIENNFSNVNQFNKVNEAYLDAYVVNNWFKLGIFEKYSEENIDEGDSFSDLPYKAISYNGKIRVYKAMNAEWVELNNPFNNKGVKFYGKSVGAPINSSDISSVVKDSLVKHKDLGYNKRSVKTMEEAVKVIDSLFDAYAPDSISNVEEANELGYSLRKNLFGEATLAKNIEGLSSLAKAFLVKAENLKNIGDISEVQASFSDKSLLELYNKNVDVIRKSLKRESIAIEIADQIKKCNNKI